MRCGELLAARVVAVVFILFVGLAVAAMVSGVAQPMPQASVEGHAGSSPAGAELGFLAVPLFCIVVATVFAWMILRSRLSG
jgi:hypothetical protein